METTTPVVPKLTKLQIKHELWRRGDLSWKMHAIQKEMLDIYLNSKDNDMMVWLLSRQTGKSWFLAMIAMMECIKNPNGIVKLLTDTKLHAQTIFEPIFRELLEDCPEDMKPTYNKTTFTYFFPNGSQIQMAGSDNGHCERLRGQKSILVLIDEAGFCDKLNNNVMSILLPTTTHTGGRLLMASTPPQDPDHDFVKFIERAEMDGQLVKKTLFQNPLLTKEQKDNIVAKFPLGINDPQFRREYLCEIIRNEENCLFPELTEDHMKKIVMDWERPAFFDSYVSIDLGWNDLTVVLFAYYDFLKNKVVVEDEIVIRGRDKNFLLPVFTQSIIDKEKELWTNVLTNEVKTPSNRVGDMNPWVRNELLVHSHHQLWFNEPQKYDKKAAVNTLRTLLANEQIIINPKCQTLIRHLRNVRWKNTRTKEEFDRSPDEGHYDAADAMLYLSRCISYTKNPYPANYRLDPTNLHVQNPNNFNRNNSSPVDIFKKVFGKTR